MLKRKKQKEISKFGDLKIRDQFLIVDEASAKRYTVIYNDGETVTYENCLISKIYEENNLEKEVCIIKRY
ncbi:MAG: hypothetical protein AAF617_16710 [Bacteroidota bacterium]